MRTAAKLTVTKADAPTFVSNANLTLAPDIMIVAVRGNIVPVANALLTPASAVFIVSMTISLIPAPILQPAKGSIATVIAPGLVKSDVHPKSVKSFILTTVAASISSPVKHPLV